MNVQRKAARALNLRPRSLNETEREVEVVWTSGATVARYGYHEQLVVNDGSVDLTRLNAGASVLNSHRTGDLSDMVGVVVEAWIKNGKGYARIKISDREDVEPLWRDLQAGIVRHVSMGYELGEWEWIEREGQEPLVRVTRFTPYELSFVSVPADAECSTRSLPTAIEAPAEEEAAEDALAETGEDAVPDLGDEAAPGADAEEAAVAPEADAPAPEAEVEAVRAAVDKDTFADITQAAIDAGVPGMAPQAIRDGLTLAQAKERFGEVATIRNLCQRARKPELANGLEGKGIEAARRALLEALVCDAEATAIDSTIPTPAEEGRSERRASPPHPTAVYRAMNAARTTPRK